MSEFLFENPIADIFAGDGPDTEPTPINDSDPIALPTVKGDANVTKRRINLGHVYHVQWPIMKHMENSPRGIRYAHQRGWSIDLDSQKDKIGTKLNTHWQRPIARDGFHDKAGKLHKNAKIKDMTPAEWGRLITKEGITIPTMADQFRLAGRLHVKVRWEPKGESHWTLEDFREMYEVAKQAGTIVVVTTLDTDPLWRQRLRFADQAGFPDTRRIRG